MTTLRQLSFLVALDETCSFSQAAGRCHVTQSTFSAGIRELEEGLGIQVAERTRQSVSMTPLGNDLAARARDVLASVADLEDHAAREAGTGGALLRMGVIPTVGPFVLPRALPLIREHLPGLKVSLREELTDSLIEALLAGRLDLVLMALPHPVPARVETRALFEDSYHLATRVDHPLANAGIVDGEDLSGRRLLLLDRGHCLQRHALSAFPEALLGEDESFAATSLPTLAAMVEEGLGITLLPDLAIAAGAVTGQHLSLTALRGARPREIVLAWRKSSARAETFDRIGGCLREARDGLFAEAHWPA
ncbi:LysR family hydrogen peroxide-inducible transcriptional activator [Palleronia aestuarii]|uniref:LysR family hydrogen peroxide-inducible transcriptional activator n=1 Tax=Palleronia aestuarii TaxID=568105 RepID=A0A2W7MYQ0_9RHOB|nr:hydrogen peroxide-inducible genes activator [Palleronia aestuarii]PZX12791.1 LysR family hydrogen peroxide-inducible transcriptional activator [Palleronia aestuarii]